MDNEALYQKRLTRIQNAIKLEPVDQVPVAFLGPAFSPRYMGMSLDKFCDDADAALQVTLDAAKKLDVDAINSLVVGRFPVILTLIWLSHIKIPGKELPLDSLWQVDEAEVMTPEDYDFIAENGWQAFTNQLLPKVIDMPYFGESMAYMMANGARGVPLFRENGIVVVASGAVTIPFEQMCGARSMQKFFLDLYRMPDRIQAAMDRALPEIIAGGISLAKMGGAMGTWVGGWRAASALVSPKLWDRFVWPYYLKIIDALLEADIVPVLHFDQNWNRDLARLRELPAKKCILNLDGMTDIRKFKEIVGDRMAVMGDVPAPLFTNGTPDDMYKYVRDLVRDVGPTGLILSSGCDTPYNAKFENVEAFMAASREYGKVSA
ncbi:MAG: uroporphyrinogen decarboxylase family protein [Anaerolineaceae bacterium]|nr:uroporphyrinogen decarboxylase family protein [Anaerolineaceae bacterium]